MLKLDTLLFRTIVPEYGPKKSFIIMLTDCKSALEKA